MNLNNVLVVNFAVNERTISLSEHCFRELGFNNYITLKGDGGFRDKFIEFANLACESNYECFLRTDADRLLFEGVYSLISEFENDNSSLCIEGVCFDFLMNKYRGATPHLFSKKAMSMLKENNDLMPDSQKPESRFIENITNNKTNCFKLVNKLTNLHDYEQYPSKVCNTLINRIFRGHFYRLYDKRHLSELEPAYCRAVEQAIGYSKSINEKKKMNYIDFSFLDEGFSIINNDEIQEKYNYYKKIYNKFKLK